MRKLWVGVDLHKGQFTCYVLGDPGKGTYSRFVTNAAGYAAFLRMLEMFRRNGIECEVAVESTGNARYFATIVERAGVLVRVINTLKFKVVSESVSKTDRRDAKTIAEFLAKDMLPEAHLCGERSEALRRLVKSRAMLVRTLVKLKNQVHGIALGYGMLVKSGKLNSRKGRAEVAEALGAVGGTEVVELLVTAIETVEGEVTRIEKKLQEFSAGDRAVEILRSIPGTGLICATTVRAFIDDIKRFESPKKLSAFAGLAPWVQQSDQSVHYGRITKHGPSELRTALVQMVLGMIKVQGQSNNRLMLRYRQIKQRHGSGKAIIATARKLSTIVWTLLTEDKEYDAAVLDDPALRSLAQAMSEEALAIHTA
jgi:transposase